MPLILYSEPTSPPVRAVLLTAEVLGLKLELRNIKFLEFETLKQEFIAINPQHTIPTLDDNGLIVWDSHVICTYLVDKYGKDDSLYPKDLHKRAIVDQRLHFDSGKLFPPLKNIFYPILVVGHRTYNVEHEKAMKEGYAFVNDFLKRSEYLAGDHLTVADFCAVATISSILPIIPIVEELPHFNRWYEKMQSLPYYKKCNGDGAEAIANKVLKKLGRM